MKLWRSEKQKLQKTEKDFCRTFSELFYSTSERKLIFNQFLHNNFKNKICFFLSPPNKSLTHISRFKGAFICFCPGLLLSDTCHSIF